MFSNKALKVNIFRQPKTIFKNIKREKGEVVMPKFKLTISKNHFTQAQIEFLETTLAAKCLGIVTNNFPS